MSLVDLPIEVLDLLTSTVIGDGNGLASAITFGQTCHLLHNIVKDRIRLDKKNKKNITQYNCLSCDRKIVFDFPNVYCYNCKCGSQSCHKLAIKSNMMVSAYCKCNEHGCQREAVCKHPPSKYRCEDHSCAKKGCPYSPYKRSIHCFFVNAAFQIVV